MHLKFTLNNGEQLLLRSENLNYELCSPRQRTNPTTGEIETEWTAYKWFASLPQALGRILETKLRHSDATTLQQLHADLETAQAEITGVWHTSIK